MVAEVNIDCCRGKLRDYKTKIVFDVSMMQIFENRMWSLENRVWVFENLMWGLENLMWVFENLMWVSMFGKKVGKKPLTQKISKKKSTMTS